jgi:hypothetical protein
VDPTKAEIVRRKYAGNGSTTTHGAYD